MKLSRLWTAILSMLGFNTCSSEPTCVYGCPTANFEANGTVTDEDGKTLGNVMVTTYTNPINPEQNQNKDFCWGSSYTDENGHYSIRSMDLQNCEFTLVTSKAGYKPDTTKFVVKAEFFTGKKDRWDLGSYIVTNNIVLKKASGEEQSGQDAENDKENNLNTEEKD